MKNLDKKLTSLNQQWLRAREIMGTNFFGVEEAVQHFGVKPTPTRLNALADIPFFEKVLLACKDTHILIAVFPLSIMDIRKKVGKIKISQSKKFTAKFYNAYESVRGIIGWHLVRKTPIDGSTFKSLAEKEALLGQDEMVPTMTVMVYMIVGHFLATGERLFANSAVYTWTLANNGRRVYVGYNSNNCSESVLYDGRDETETIGIASEKKPF